MVMWSSGNMSAQINNHPIITTKGGRFMDFKKMLLIMSERPIKSLIISLVVVATIAGIYYATATTYACVTQTIDNHQYCLKYQIYPPPTKTIGIVSSTACPNNPPSNCP